MELPRERPDDLDRIKSPAAKKLLMLCELSREQLGVDPRSGAASFVAIPRVLDAIWNELPPLMRTTVPVIVVGVEGADVVFKWEGVPFIVRDIGIGDPRALSINTDLSAIRNVNLRAVLNTRLESGELRSTQGDRRIAGEMRWRASKGLSMLQPVREVIA